MTLKAFDLTREITAIGEGESSMEPFVQPDEGAGEGSGEDERGQEFHEEHHDEGSGEEEHREEDEHHEEDELPDYIKEMEEDAFSKIGKKASTKKGAENAEDAFTLKDEDIADLPEEVRNIVAEKMRKKLGAAKDFAAKATEGFEKVAMERDALKEAVAAVGKPPATSSQQPSLQLDTTIQNTTKELELARKNLRDAQTGLNPDLDYDTCLVAYEKAYENHLDAKAQARFSTVTETLQKNERNEAIRAADAMLTRTWSPSRQHPIPWHDENPEAPTIKKLFSMIAQEDPDIEKSIPVGTPKDRAEWMEARVKEKFPKTYMIAAERIRKAEAKRFKEKERNNPRASVKSGSPIAKNSRSLDPANATDAVLKWLGP